MMAFPLGFHARNLRAGCLRVLACGSLSVAYIRAMLWRVRSSRGRPKNVPAAFIQPCRPTVSTRPPSGPGWAHELKHDGYRLQIHIRDGRVKLYTINAADWTKRYPRIAERAAQIKGSAIIDAEAVWLDTDGIAQFDALHNRVMDHVLDGDDLRHKPLAERKATLRKVLRRTKGAFNTSNIPKAMVQKCSKQSASSAWKASFQNGLMRHIAQVRAKAGSRSRIRRHQQLRELSTGASDPVPMVQALRGHLEIAAASYLVY